MKERFKYCNKYIHNLHKFLIVFFETEEKYIVVNSLFKRRKPQNFQIFNLFIVRLANYIKYHDFILKLPLSSNPFRNDFIPTKAVNRSKEIEKITL